MALALTAIAAVLVGGHARAQVDLLDETPDPGAAVAPTLDEVSLRIDRFGLGGTARPGDWTPIRLLLEENTSRQREVVVRVAVDDADGDTTAYVVRLSTNPGVRQPVWVYVRLPHSFGQDTPVLLSVFEADDSAVGGAQTEQLGAGLGRLIFHQRTDARLAGRSLVSQGESLLAVVGAADLGLGAYSWRAAGAPGLWLPFGHEPSRVASGITIDALPDRWHGYSSASALIWSDGRPSELGLEQSRALREWVDRGGHLVIVLPEVGQEWQSLTNTVLSEMVPSVAVTRRESVEAEPYRRMLTSSLTRALPASWTIHELAPMATAEPGQAECVLAGPDGGCVVVRRHVGLGAVTLVGLPLGSPSVRALGLPEADVFWHRVLGRRGALVPPDEAGDINLRPGINVVSRQPYAYDSDLGEEIARSGRSATGVLLGLIVFAAYWAVAGPVSYFVLRSRGVLRHAWIAFVVTGAIFTGVAWGGAWLIRPKTLSVTHLSFVDHVFGAREQRTRTFASVLVPEYGQATVRVGNPSEREARGRGGRTHLVGPWEPPTEDHAGSGRFPDARSYLIEARSPEAMTFPTRATVKQVAMDWHGGLAWRSIRPVTASDDPGLPIIERAAPGSSEAAAGVLLKGILQHELPAGLSDVLIVWVSEQSPLHARGSRVPRTAPSGSRSPLSDEAAGSLLARVRMWAPDFSATEGRWEPGTPLDLALVARGAGLPRLGIPRASIDLGLRGAGAADPETRDDRLLRLAFFDQLDPPEFSPNSALVSVAVQRAATHGLDLSRWFTQPCVMVLGILDAEGEGTCPTPFAIDTGGGERDLEISGRTVVRWIYPLPPAPPSATPPATAPEDAR